MSCPGPKSHRFWCWYRRLQCCPAILLSRGGGGGHPAWWGRATVQSTLCCQVGPLCVSGVPFPKSLLAEEAEPSKEPGRSRSTRNGVPLKEQAWVQKWGWHQGAQRSPEWAPPHACMPCWNPSLILGPSCHDLGLAAQQPGAPSCARSPASPEAGTCR